jgi:hypothetical protein
MRMALGRKFRKFLFLMISQMTFYLPPDISAAFGTQNDVVFRYNFSKTLNTPFE